MKKFWRRLKTAWAVLTETDAWCVLIPSRTDVIISLVPDDDGSVTSVVAACAETNVTDTGEFSPALRLAVDLSRLSAWEGLVPAIQKMDREAVAVIATDGGDSEESRLH